MYNYPRLPKKSPSYCTYIFVIIDAIFTIVFTFLSIRGFMIPFILIGIFKGLTIYNFFISLKHPEWIKSNRKYYLTIPVFNLCLCLLLFFLSVYLFISLLFKSHVTELDIIICFILFVPSVILSIPGLLNLLYIVELINSETTYGCIPQIMYSQLDFKYTMN